MQKSGLVKVELLLLGAMVGITAFTVLFAYLFSASQAADEERVKDVSFIYKALNLYFSQNGYYPDGANALVPAGMEAYVDHWPSTTSNCPAPYNHYSYSQKSNGSDYVLTFCLSNSTQGLAAGAHSLTSKGVQ